MNEILRKSWGLGAKVITATLRDLLLKNKKSVFRSRLIIKLLFMAFIEKALFLFVMAVKAFKGAITYAGSSFNSLRVLCPKFLVVSVRRKAKLKAWNKSILDFYQPL